MIRLSEGTLWFFAISAIAMLIWLLWLRYEVKTAKEREVQNSKVIDDLKKSNEALALEREVQNSKVIGDLKKSNEALAFSLVQRESEAKLAVFRITGLESLVAEKSKAFPWLSKAKVDFDDLIAEKAEHYLRTKKHSAHKSAEDVKNYRLKAKESELLYRRILHRQQYCEYLYPWLSDLFDEEIASLLDQLDIVDPEAVDDQIGDSDPAQNFMSKAEYERLSEPDRNQMALDRFLSSKKTKWQIGREFERFVGHRLEKDNFAVKYFGATEGLEDLGRDLIATRKQETLIVQCKYWSSKKTIHEKHIYQLYGTCVDYIIEQNVQPSSHQGQLFRLENTQNVKAVFLTTAQLSDRAKRAADILGVEYEELPTHSWNYPRVKCNVSKRDGAKIYHLPFDQQYDRVKIEPSDGEFYSVSCAEAHAKGFRRAWRWRGGGHDG